MLKILVLLGGFSLTGVAGALPRETFASLDAVARRTEKWFHDLTRPDAESCSLEILNRSLPAYPWRLLSRRASMVTVMRHYIRQAEKRGRNPLFVIHDVEQTLATNLSNSTTGEELFRTFARGFTPRSSWWSEKGLSLAELQISPLRPDLKRLVEKFNALGLRVHAASLHTMLMAELTLLAYEYAETHGFHWESTHRPTPEALEPMRGFHFESGSRLVFHSFQTGWDTFRPAGIYLAGYIEQPNYFERVMHEVAHAVQDDEWDYRFLIDEYIRAILPVRNDPAQEPVKATIRATANRRVKKMRFEFQTLTRHPWRRQSILNRGDEAGMDEVNWFEFLGWVDLLRETDAYWKQGLYGLELGFRNESLVNPQLLVSGKVRKHVEHWHADSEYGIHPQVFARFPERETLEMLKRLNGREPK